MLRLRISAIVRGVGSAARPAIVGAFVAAVLLVSELNAFGS